MASGKSLGKVVAKETEKKMMRSVKRSISIHSSAWAQKRPTSLRAETKFTIFVAPKMANEFLISRSMHVARSAGTRWMKWKAREQLQFNAPSVAGWYVGRCNERRTTNKQGHTHTPARTRFHVFEWSRPFKSYSIYQFRAHRVARIPFRLVRITSWYTARHGHALQRCILHPLAQSCKFVV